jgi:hypothetical protein
MNNKNNNTKKADPSTLKNAAESFKNSWFIYEIKL